MSEKIVLIPIEELGDFPRQNEIYGEANVEAEFVASIKECGIITPVIICQSSDLSINSEYPYIIISGHRRKEGALRAGLTEIPATMRYYESYESAELEFLTCNMQREKSDRVRIKEFLQYKQVLCQLGKVRKKSRSYEGTIFENKMFSRILEDNIKSDDLSEISLDSVAILKEVTGYTKYEQEMLVVLYDGDWLQKQLDKLRNLGCPADIENNLIELREIAVKEYEAEKCSLNNAVSEVKKIFREAEERLKPKSKPGNANQVKKIIVKKQPKAEPLLYDIPEESNVEFCFKAKGFSLGVVRNLGHIVAFCIDAPGGGKIINSDKIIEMCEL